MAKKHTLTAEEATELFSALDDSGVLDPIPARRRTRRTKKHRLFHRSKGAPAPASVTAVSDDSAADHAIDPLSGDDPSGSTVDTTISRAGFAFIMLLLAFIVGLQIWYGVSRRLNTANLSETVNTETVSTALEGGLEWGDGFTQFPQTFTVDQADERTGIVEVSVVDTDSANELELFANSQLQSTALATNALLNDNINQVIYNVAAIVDDDGSIAQSSFFGLVPAQGTERTIFTFVWTKHTSDDSSTIDWELQIIGMDEEIAASIQEQVNSVSSLIEDPSLSQDDIEAQNYERQLELGLRDADTLRSAETEDESDEEASEDASE